MKCILCNGINFTKLFSVGGKDIVSCTQCGLTKTESVSTDYTHYHRDEDYLKFESSFLNIFKKRFDIISKFKKSGVVLDIGAATGAMLMIFKERGWETWGIEPSESASFAKKKGIRIVKQTFEKATLKDNYFDAIVLNHTLEHVDNPLIVLEKVRKILKKGGVVLIDVPNFGSFSSQIYKNRWPYLLPKEHTYHFTEDTLTKLLKKASLTPIYSETRSGLFDYSNPIKEVIEALFTLKKRFFKDVLGFPGAFISTIFNRGTSLTVVAKK